MREFIYDGIYKLCLEDGYFLLLYPSGLIDICHPNNDGRGSSIMENERIIFPEELAEAIKSIVKSRIKSNE